ncbi:NAD-dependent histone deacetylase HST3 [Rhizoctonia solani AG-1 IB]|uniref:NAD-dependent histone deacetylase HST3 n=1 Tax=Thanatephorus cucumeris (strain AG1-IB / isolate 7/3/14) TaxID=1108050 RepID=M5C5F5_THACB|nr:NAD-dependent histone deacetylase HST3 [Rhizoctonia solani AG-1 IB]
MSSKSFKDHPVAAYQPKDHQKQRSFIIPTISYDQPTDKKAYHQVQRACGAASHVVVVCGAGISTNAGIPDFRSADGLYNKALPGLSKTLGPEMFDARVLQDREKLLSYGRAMGSLRIASKRTSPTNVDGLQTSNHPQLAGHVLELHGNIHQVQCNQYGQSPDEDPNIIDQLLLKDGYVSLLTLPEGKTGAGSKWNLRSLPPGLLLPKVLHNEGSWEIELDGKLMDELEQMDSVASLLYILGTSIRTDGAAKLIRALAKQVHNNNGIVVYVDRQALRDRKLASYFDLQIQSDLDVWAKDACQSLNNLLANSVRNMNQLCKKSDGASLFMLCAVDHLLEQTTFEQLQDAFDSQAICIRYNGSTLQFVMLHDTELGKLSH